MLVRDMSSLQFEIYDHIIAKIGIRIATDVHSSIVVTLPHLAIVPTPGAIVTRYRTDIEIDMF
jgi:hypothetical protein